VTPNIFSASVDVQKVREVQKVAVMSIVRFLRKECRIYEPTMQRAAAGFSYDVTKPLGPDQDSQYGLGLFCIDGLTERIPAGIH
jgi:hypothetical protein